MKTILSNAIQSIQVGVEDFESTDEKRILSATRNIVAGVLLTIKHLLKEASPEGSDDVLLKQLTKLMQTEDGTFKAVGAGKKTVDFEQMKQNGQLIGLDVDWMRLKEITVARNDIEHYHTSHTKAKLAEVVSRSFSILHSLCLNHFKKDPSDLFGAETWESMLRARTLNKELETKCRVANEKISWPSELYSALAPALACGFCDSELILVDNPTQDATCLSYRCQICGRDNEFSDIVEKAVEHHFEVDSYIAAKDGGDDPIEMCSECCRETFVCHEGLCVACGESLQYESCSLCGESLNSGDQDLDGLCSYHHHMANKDD